jgi:hypothetical protein
LNRLPRLRQVMSRAHCGWETVRCGCSHSLE